MSLIDMYFLLLQLSLKASKFKRLSPPMDHSISLRKVWLGDLLKPYISGFSLEATMLDKEMQKQWPELDPVWRILPAPPMSQTPGASNDDFIPSLANGSVISINDIKSFTSNGIMVNDVTTPTSKDQPDVDHENGSVVQVECDAVIFCTGTMFDFSNLSAEIDPTCYPTPEWDANPYRAQLPFSRLYKGFLHPSYPDCIAFLAVWGGFHFSAFVNADMHTQAIAQLWSGGYPMPSQSEIDSWCDESYRKSLDKIKTNRINRLSPQGIQGNFATWLCEVTGNGVHDYLGWSLKAWKFWWNERQLYRLIMDGVLAPYVYRLFDGRENGRKKWDGARDAIMRENGVM